ncbi:hypothetical protein ZHAS_00008896 [Anopheles sinensis]|uniref:Peptidase S1 domain-containing protein n=1 Tax=Anopheles sinensis TaxID=74873 RepID=A0A084VTD6_ANOSI|nr:hypothetical protein ZHAS_00008896 [Anopheles sinensis]
MFCAGGKNNVSACNGDSGGGMFFNIDGTWYLRGIVSFSPSRPEVDKALCDITKPTVFTDVSKYQDWLIRYINTTEWLKNLKPCNDSIIGRNTECNAVNRYDGDFFIVGEKESIVRVKVSDASASNEIEHINQNDLGGLDYDCAGGRVYWSEPATRTIFSAKYDGTDKKPFITEDLEEPRHVAVDWISRRLYWVDYGKEAIEVASLDNPAVRMVVNMNVNDPNEIAVDPLFGKLYRIHKNFLIESSNLDGTDEELLLDSSTMWISDLKLSMATEELCFVNQETFKIECINFFNKRIRSIASNLTSPHTLSVTDGMFYWTEGNGGTIESINHQNRRQPSIEYNKSKDVISLIAVTNVCPMVYSPCAINNGNCPDGTICLYKSREISGKACITIRSKINGQYKFSPRIGNMPSWYALIEGVPDFQYCEGSIITRNAVLSGRIYWTHNKTIYSAMYNGTDKKIFTTKGLKDPRSVAVDWISRRLYWVEHRHKAATIMVASLDNPELQAVVSTDADYTEIAVDPVLGILYRLLETGGIVKSNLDGSEPENIKTSKTHKLYNIRVSVATGEVCYINQTTSNIECMNPLTNQFRTVVSGKPKTWALTQGRYYWIEENSPCAINNGKCPENTICLPNPPCPMG